MPDNRVQGIVGGFGAGSRAGIDSRSLDVKEAEAKVQQRNQLRKEGDASVADALVKLQEAGKSNSINAFSPDGNREEAIRIQTETAKALWKSTQQMLEAGKQQGLYTDAEIANIKERFRIGASLNNPAAEQRLEEAEKTRGAVATAAGKGRVEQQQVQTGDITGYLNTKTNDVVRGYVRNGRAFNAVTNEELSADYIPTKSLSGVEGGAGVGNSTKDKTLAAAAELRAVQENTDASIGELQNFVRSEDYVEGFTEDAIQLLNSGFQQIFQLSGNENIVEESILNNSVIDLDNLSDANIGFLRRAAIGGDVRDSAKARLSYILAKQLDPNGRISNADVENAERILSGSADRAGTLLTLGQLRSRSARETNVKLGTMEQLLKSPETLFEKVDVTTGLKTNQSLDDMSDAEYNLMLNQSGQNVRTK